MTDEPPSPAAPLFGPVVCRRDGHDWIDQPGEHARRTCVRCGAAADADGRTAGVSPRLLALAVAVGVLVGGWLTVGFLMHGVVL
ncbi:hypothetical protein [Halomarina pelagica]|uniref:hypothetical protein n=1 Tax=Halomarina pelagica TaxID=2961599 RepID=UPI0020C2C316|nr:hypothetical protein [Halomarina sp. BND7]